jgi:hypothetical protein
MITGFPEASDSLLKSRTADDQEHELFIKKRETHSRALVTRSLQLPSILSQWQ